MEEFITGETYNIIANAQFIFINEAQFFESIDKWVLFLNVNLKKTVILCGLDLDYKRDSFGTMMNLLPYASKIYPLSGLCNGLCNGLSRYSHRIVNNDKQILIGIHEYVPLCEECYNALMR
jgi:thymidine kinase